MAHEERRKTKAFEQEKKREDSAFFSDVLRVLPNGLKLRFVLHAIAHEKQLKESVHEER